MDESHNPYQPPTAKVETTAELRPINLAGKGRRFGTFVVDYVGAMVLAIILVALLVVFFGEQLVTKLERIPDLVLGIGLWLIYYNFFEGIWSRTPGKWIFGTVVVTEDGGRPAFGTIFRRTWCRMIPFDPLSFFGQRGWHDSLSHTHVVLARTE